MDLRQSLQRSARLAALAAALACALGATGCRSDEERFQDHRARAAQFRAENQNAEALLELRSALALDPQDVVTNFEIAELLREEGRPQGSLFYYAEARRLDPGFVEAYLAEARLLLQMDPERSVSLIESVLGQKRNHPGALALLAQVRLVRRNLPGALEAANAAVESGPDQAEPHHVLGEVQLAQSLESASGSAEEQALFPAALASFERAAELADAASRWRSLVGRAALLSVWPERAGEAGAAYREAIEAARKSPEGEHPLLAVQAARDYARSIGDDDLRRQFLELAVDVDATDMGGWLALARLEEEVGGSPDAVFARLLERRPDDPNAHLVWADWLSDHGRSAEGIVHLERALQTDVESPLLIESLSTLQLELGQREAFGRNVERLESEYPDHAATRHARARRAILERPREEAAALVRELAGRHEDAEMQRLLALAEFRLGNLETATAAIDRALQLGTLSPVRALAQKLRIRHAAGDWEASLFALSRLVTLRRLQREEELILARSLYGLAREREGRAILAQLASGEKPYLPAVLELAMRELAEDPQAARARLERAQAQYPENGLLLRRLILYDVALGQEQRALERLDAALASAPEQPSLHVERAKLLGRLGRLEEAEAEARQALALAPDAAEGVSVLIKIARARGQGDEAIALLQRQDGEGGLGTEDRVLLARLLMARGDTQPALEHYERLLASGVGDPRLKNDLALLLARSGGSLERARALAHEVLQTQPDDPAVFDTLGFILLREARPVEAEEQFRTAIRLAEEQELESAAYHYHLGLALRMDGLDRSAIEAFDRALALDPGFPEADAARAERESAQQGRAFRLEGA